MKTLPARINSAQLLTVGKCVPDLHRLGAAPDLTLEAFGHYPPWSPVKLGRPFPSPVDRIFHKDLFYALQQREPSKTTTRLLNEKISRLRQRGIAPDWLPHGLFSPDDLAHLVVLALASGAAAAADLADMAADNPKLARWIDDAAYEAMEMMERADKTENSKPLMLLFAAMKLTGLTPKRRGTFFTIIENPDLSADPDVQFLFDWIVDGIGAENVVRAAERIVDRYGTDSQEGRYAFRFLHTRLLREAEEYADEQWRMVESLFLENLRTPAQVSPHHQHEETSTPPEKASIPRRPTTPPTRTGTEISPGVVLTPRAAKEIKRERWIAKDRLVCGLGLLGEYRRMRLGEMSYEAYHDAVRSQHFIDAPCFADPSSLKAFADDYTVTEDGVPYTLDRHLKWGKGNNAYSAIRIYFAWDAANARVIVGSAPRHLPIWWH